MTGEASSTRRPLPNPQGPISLSLRTLSRGRWDRGKLGGRELAQREENTLGIRSLLPVPASFNLESAGSALTGEWVEGGGRADGQEPRHAGRECGQKCPAPHPTSMRTMNPQGWEAGAGQGSRGGAWVTSRHAPSDSLLQGSGLARESSPSVTGVRVFKPRRLTSLHQVSKPQRRSSEARLGQAWKELGAGGWRNSAPKLLSGLLDTLT